MDAEHAIADLMEVSSQVETAVLVGPSGGVEGSSLPAEKAERLAEAARRLLEAAASAGSRELTQLEAATHDGSVFVASDGGWTVAATTGPAATVGLVFYDLRTCLRSLAAEEAGPAAPKAKGRRGKQASPEAGDGDAAA